MSELEILQQEIRTCKKCHLCKTIPEFTTPVAGVGPADSKIMFLGEGPGMDEQLMGEPFVGLSGQLLNKMMTQAGLLRQNCYIANVVNCNPRTDDGKKNRAPTTEEISVCKVWLWKQMKLIQPKIIVTLGKVSTSTLLKDQLPKQFTMFKIIGKEHNVPYISSIIIPCLHPSFLLQYGKQHVENTINIFINIRNRLGELNENQN